MMPDLTQQSHATSSEDSMVHALQGLGVVGSLLYSTLHIAHCRDIVTFGSRTNTVIVAFTWYRSILGQSRVFLESISSVP